MTKCKYIDEFIETTRPGRVPVSKEIRQAADLIENKLSDPDAFIDIDQIEVAIELIERYFEITLFPWELLVLALAHCFYQSTDTVVFSEFFIMMGRGAGKNGFISALAWYFTTHYHGIRGYNVDIIANSEDQAKTSFDDVYDVLERTWEKSKNFFYKSKEVIQNLKTKSYIRFNTSNARTKDGKRSACLIFDEIHEYQSSATIQVFRSGFGKRKHSRTFYITTNGYVRDGVLDEKLRIAHDVLNGEIPTSRMCPLIWKLDTDAEADNPELWVKANPSLPFFPLLKTEMDQEYLDKKYDKTVELDFYTKRMNLPRSNMEVAVTEWANIQASNRTLPDLDGWPCVAGIDYALITDFASVNLHFKDDETRYDISHSWLCLQSNDLHRLKIPWREWADAGLITLVDDVQINPELLAQYLYEQAQKYSILKLGLDNNRYSLVANALRKVGFDKRAYDNVQLVRPNDIYKIQPVINSVFTRKNFVWGDNPALRWAVNNTKLLRAGAKDGTDTGNFYYAKIEAKSRKTDPFMALVASMVVEDALPEAGRFDFPSLGVITG